jgi:zinc protease
MNLREDKGWSYNASSQIHKVPNRNQTFVISTKVQADKAASSLEELVREIDEYTGSVPMTAAEITRLKDVLGAKFSAQFNDDDAYMKAVMDAARYGNPRNHAEAFNDRLNAITLEQVRAVVTETIRPDELTWVVAGDLATFEKEVRALGLGKVEVWDIYGDKVR